MARTRRRNWQTVTIDDVARHAGVSSMTVSRVMNAENGVRETTRETVMKAVTALNYQPNRSARRLAKGADVHIGLIYANPSDSYLGRFLRGALEAAQDSDNHLIVDICEDNTSAAYVASAMRLAKAGIAGVILPPPTSAAEEILTVFDELKIPVATVANGKSDRKSMDINIDDAAAATMMTEYLISLGHREIAFITGPKDQMSSTLREQGYREAMAAANLAIKPEWIVQGEYTYRSGVSATKDLLAAPSRPSAIFASNDDMAAAAIGVAHRHGLIVPDDLTIVGFDDSPSAISVWPELTTIDQPVSAMASSAFNLVLGKAEPNSKSDGALPFDYIHPCRLIKRGSSGPANVAN